MSHLFQLLPAMRHTHLSSCETARGPTPMRANFPTAPPFSLSADGKRTLHLRGTLTRPFLRISPAAATAGHDAALVRPPTIKNSQGRVVMKNILFAVGALALASVALAAPPAAPVVTVGVSNIKQLQFDWDAVPGASRRPHRGGSSAPQIANRRMGASAPGSDLHLVSQPDLVPRQPPKPPVVARRFGDRHFDLVGLPVAELPHPREQ